MSIENEKKVVQPFFWFMSFCCLFLPVAFRGNGVDHESYLLFFQEIGAPGWKYFSTYNGFPEPMFALINVVAGQLGDFQYVYIISAFIALFFTYKSFARKVNELSLATCVFLFSTLFYSNLFGLTRMCIAVGIVTYAYRYIEEKNFKVYLIYIIAAALFHYSAIIMVPLYFIFKGNPLVDSTTKNFKKNIMSLGLLLGVFLIFGFAVQNFSNLPWLGRYAQYFEGTSLSVINNAAGQYLLIILLFRFGGKITQNEKYGSIYINMFITMIIFLLGSVFVSFMRLTYFLYPASYYLYAYIIRCFDNPKERLVYRLIVFIMLSVWFFYKINSPLWEPYLIPYFIKLP